ncbi:MAG: purine nucleoside permease [Geminicoccaceae bacterium]
MRRLSLWILVGMALLLPAAARAHAPLPVRVMIVTAFADERAAWEQARPGGRTIALPGLPADYPTVRCWPDRVCLLTTGMGHANAATTIAALAFSQAFDLRRTWWVVTGIGGINPEIGTLGSAAWADWLVAFGLQWELDARDRPPGWPTGYTGLFTDNPAQKPGLDYGTEVYRLDPRLVQRAFELSRNVRLADGATAAETRARYPAPASRPPSVLRCDTVSGDTWFSGRHLARRAEAWTRLLTDGKGRYCTTQQEDNAIYAALVRAAAAGLVDAKRVAVLRTGADFDRPPPGGSAADNLLNFDEQGGGPPALANLVIAARPLVDAIAGDWAAWRHGVPAAP